MASDTPLLSAEAAMRGISALEMAQLVIAKAAKADAAIAEIEVRRQVAQAAIRAASNPAEIEAALTASTEG